MSIKALHWAWHVDDLDMGPAFLLAKLGDMCDQDHSCYPDHKYLMKMIRVKSRNTLRKHMDVLYERDLVRLQIQHSSKGLRINNRYYLAVDGKEDATGTKSARFHPFRSRDCTIKKERPRAL